MENLNAFLSQNKVKVDNIKFVASKNFVDENGDYKLWEIKKIDAEMESAIRKECMITVQTGKRGKPHTEFDNDKYMLKICVASTVYPNLYNAELQDSYGVKDPGALLLKMLDGGEYINYLTKVIDHNGLDISENDLIDEAKN